MQVLCVKNCGRRLILGLLVAIYFPVFSQVKINEVHVQPFPDSLSPSDFITNCLDSTASGAEWVEIYNTSLCDTIDLECYMLASRTSDSNYTTFAFPAGTFLPPLSFLVIGGTNAPNADFRLPDYCFTANRCGTANWFLNNDFGWIALYDKNEIVQDALYWTATSGQPQQLLTNPAYSGQPCVPSSCAATADTLKAASTMLPGTDILYAGKASASGLTIYRQTDGTGGWQTDGNPTPRNCNGVCATPTDLALQITASGDETCLQGNGWALVEYSGGRGPYDVDWSNQSNADSLTNLDAGCYKVTVTDSLGCYTSDSICLVNIGTPVTVSITPEQSTIFKGESIPLMLVTQATLDSIFWTPATGLSCSDCDTTIASPDVITTYNVDVIDADGCTGSASATVAVLSDQNSAFIPTAFTPNGDNLNPKLFVRSPKLSALEFRIYDRWGTEVFATTDINTGWDGRDKNGNEVDVGIYVYYAIVTFDNGKSKTLKGNVGVIR